jgi:hypothetical protein
MMLLSLSPRRAGAYRGHPRLSCGALASKTWVAGTRGRHAYQKYWLVLPFGIVAAFATAVIAHGAEAPPPCANCAAEQTLPSPDVVPDAPPKPPVPPNDPAVQVRLPGCAVWTDRCVTCQREAGRISCSNIGIACQPQAVECVRSEAEEEKK